ncbi:MAG: glycerol-3-phosphate 1-O-acyltransferase PlsY [Flavobacteriales bacterium]|nr:glycerol-3-phosphate 1-O-acyltransferase PlsY [Flavobacteriales bacterium]
MLNTEHILFLILAYFTGSFPSAVWVGRTFYNKDVREYGSGNAGATNTFRVLGKGAGIPVLLMDIFKGWISVNYIYFITDGCNPFIETVTSSQFEIQLALGIAAVIGHLFPIYSGFRGGKGIATLLGLLIGLNPIAAIASIVVFVIVFLISKYVSLGSILASLAFPFVVFIILDEKDVNASLELFSVFVPILTLITHQKNIERLIRGEENKVKFDKK